MSSSTKPISKSQWVNIVCKQILHIIIMQLQLLTNNLINVCGTSFPSTLLPTSTSCICWQFLTVKMAVQGSCVKTAAIIAAAKKKTDHMTLLLCFVCTLFQSSADQRNELCIVIAVYENETKKL